MLFLAQTAHAKGSHMPDEPDVDHEIEWMDFEWKKSPGKFRFLLNVDQPWRSVLKVWENGQWTNLAQGAADGVPFDPSAKSEFSNCAWYRGLLADDSWEKIIAVGINNQIFLLTNKGYSLKLPYRWDAEQEDWMVNYDPDQRAAIVSIVKGDRGYDEDRRVFIYTEDNQLFDLGVVKDRTFLNRKARTFTLNLKNETAKIDGREFNLRLGRVENPESRLGAKRVRPPKIDPVEKLKRIKGNADYLLEDMKKEVFGQDYALERVTKAYSERKLDGSGKPKVIVAMGPSGGGKTLTAKTFAKVSGASAVLEVNGNEYSSWGGHLEYTRLLGDGEGSNGALVDWLYANDGRGVLIINEGDKMHPDVWKKLMEFLDTGVITDAEGNPVRAVELTVFITSNRGASRMFPVTGKDWTPAEVDKRVRSFSTHQLKGYFTTKDGLDDSFVLPPEVTNRVDEYIPFGPLTRESAVQLAESHSETRRIADKPKHKINVKMTEAAIRHAALTGFNHAIDGREIRRRIDRIHTTALQDALHPLDLKSNDRITVSVTKDAEDNPLFRLSANKKNFDIPAPKDTVSNPILDPALAKVLLGLNGRLKETVIGQDEAIDQLANAIVSHASKGIKVRPFVGLFLGPSGVGKSEIARALALALYGSEDHLAVVPMGNISNVSDYTTYFGAPAQMQGGDVKRPFEQALIDNPSGGVMLLDEISNVGGGDPKAKLEILMKFYDMLEKGVYVSPIDGTEYPLTNWKFIMSGNDLEEPFLGVTADDILLETWKEEKSQAKIREKLIEKGFTNAFLNRNNLIALFKPLLKAEIVKVTEKFWLMEKQAFEKENPHIKIETSDETLKLMGETFFTSDEGGRSMRKVYENNLGALLTYALLRSELDLRTTRNLRVDVTLEVDGPGKVYRTAGSKARSVILKATVYRGNDLVREEKLDLTSAAPAHLMVNAKSALIVALHEAGHAVVNVEEITGKEFAYATIRGGQVQELKYYGYARYRELQKHNNVSVNPDREQVMLRIAQLWAGRKAQELAGYNSDAGWQEDLRQIRRLATLFLVHWGLDPEFVGIPLDDDGEPNVGEEVSRLLEKRVQEMIKEGEVLSEKMLKERWRLVRAFASELVREGDIDAKRFNEIRAQFSPDKASVRKAPAKADWTYEQYQQRETCAQQMVARVSSEKRN